MEVTNFEPKPAVRFRKNIDLKMETKQTLSLQAVQCGMNLKAYIELMLERLAEMEEDKILAALSNVAGAQTALSGLEHTAFEHELMSW